jgi:hypothetical protein
MYQATNAATRMVAFIAMDNSFFSYAGTGNISPDLKPRIERILDEQYREAKRLLESNKEAVIAIAEALILRNELNDIDVNEILARVEAEHPFVDIRKTEGRPFGLVSARALPEPTAARRSRRNGNGHANGNGKSPNGQPGEVIVPVISPPAEPPTPAAEIDPRPESESEEPAGGQ